MAFSSRLLSKSRQVCGNGVLLRQERLVPVRHFAQEAKRPVLKGDEMLKNIFLDVKKKFEAALGILRKEKITIDSKDPAAVAQYANVMKTIREKAELFDESQRILYTIQERTRDIADVRTYLLTLKEIRIRRGLTDELGAEAMMMNALEKVEKELKKPLLRADEKGTALLMAEFEKINQKLGIRPQDLPKYGEQLELKKAKAQLEELEKEALEAMETQAKREEFKDEAMVEGSGAHLRSKTGKELHVVMLPWSAFGHLMPFFQLSIALAKAKVHVSYISTPRNIQRLPKISPDLQPFIHLVPIPFPPLEPDFLPEGAEASVDVPFEKSVNLMIAYDLLQTSIKKFIADQMPDWIVPDFAAHWVVDIAKEYSVPLVYFSPFAAASSVFFGPPENLTGENRNYSLPSPKSLTSPPKWITFPSLVAFKEYEAIYVPQGFWGADASGISGASRLAKIMSGSKALSLRTCNEIEGDYLEVYEKITGKPVIPTGVLPPDQPSERVKEEMNPHGFMFDWLDKQNHKSVVFVGFGSECKLSEKQVHEIAHGLELSDLPFIWGLRKPTNDDEVDDFLPSGFVDRTSEKGLVCFGWVPQMEILAHPSVGGSLFHSGWGSVIETLQFGHCLVLWPSLLIRL